MPDLKKKWLNDKRAKLKGQLASLQRHAQQLQQELQTISIQIIKTRDELEAIEEVTAEFNKKEKKKK